MAIENTADREQKDAIDLLIKAALIAGIGLSGREKDLFETYLGELIAWNRRINLTAIESPREIILKHFIDSIIISKFVDLKGSLADIGSGAGFPGIPLKIVKEEIRLVLIEPRRKRANFIRHLRGRLCLTDVEVFNCRAEGLAGKRTFDYIISRALGGLEYLCKIAVPLLKPKGCLVSMQGSRQLSDDDERVVGFLGIKKIKSHLYSLPYGAGERSISLFVKCST